MRMRRGQWIRIRFYYQMLGGDVYEKIAAAEKGEIVEVLYGLSRKSGVCERNGERIYVAAGDVEVVTPLEVLAEMGEAS